MSKHHITAGGDVNRGNIVDGLKTGLMARGEDDAPAQFLKKAREKHAGVYSKHKRERSA